MSRHDAGPREEWLAGLAHDYAAAAREAAADYDPEDADVDYWTPTAETGLHVVRPQPARGGVPCTCGDEDVPVASRAAGGHDDTLPVPTWTCSCDGCWACGGHATGCTCDVDWDDLYERARP